MNDVRGQKRHRAPRHASLPVGTGRHTATSSRAATGTQAPTRFDADPDGATGCPVETYAGHATDTDTRTGVGTSSTVGTGVAGTGGAGGGATGGTGSGGGYVRRPNRHRATPWIVAHRGIAAAGAVSMAALTVITAALIGGGRPVGPAATGGGEWTAVPAFSPAPAVPSAGALSVPLPAASPTTGAGTREPGHRAGGQGRRDRAHPGPKRSPGPPDRTPKQHPSPGRPTPDAATTAGPGTASSPP
jgi:hypothetical protein